MQLNKSESKIALLSNKDEFFSGGNILCWEKKEEHLSIYAFSAIYKTEEELYNNYTDLRDHVAISFQSQMLEKDSERWNIYIFYFVNGQVSENIKQLIEQDKFSTRKFVCDDNPEISESIIIETINKELFDFKICKRAISETTMDELLKKSHNQVYNALISIGDKHDENTLHKLITLLGNEQN